VTKVFLEVSKVSRREVVKNGWLVGVALLVVSTLAFVQAQKGLEEQLAGVRLGAQFIDYDDQGRLKPDCLLAIYGMPDYIIGRGAAPAQPGMMPGMPGMPDARNARWSYDAGRTDDARRSNDAWWNWWDG